MSSSGNPLLYAVVGFVVGILFFYGGFASMRKKRLIENTPTSKVRSLAMGLVEVYGVVMKATEFLASPLRKQACAYYKFTIEEYRSTGKSSRWVTLSKREAGVPFYLADKTGKVLVDPTGARVELSKDYEVSSGSGRDPPSTVKECLQAEGLKFEGFLGANKRMRYREWTLEPKTDVYVMGTAGDNPSVENATAQQNVDDIMIQKGNNEKYFFISDKDEKSLLQGLRWKIIGGFLGGGALIIGCLGVILLYL